MQLLRFLCAAVSCISVVRLCQPPYDTSISGYCLHFSPSEEKMDGCSAHKYCAQLGGVILTGDTLRLQSHFF